MAYELSRRIGDPCGQGHPVFGQGRIEGVRNELCRCSGKAGSVRDAGSDSGEGTQRRAKQRDSRHVEDVGRSVRASTRRRAVVLAFRRCSTNRACADAWSTRLVGHSVAAGFIHVTLAICRRERVINHFRKP